MVANNSQIKSKEYNSTFFDGLSSNGDIIGTKDKMNVTMDNIKSSY